MGKSLEQLILYPNDKPLMLLKIAPAIYGDLLEKYSIGNCIRCDQLNKSVRYLFFKDLETRFDNGDDLSRFMIGYGFITGQYETICGPLQIDRYRSKRFNDYLKAVISIGFRSIDIIVNHNISCYFACEIVDLLVSKAMPSACSVDILDKLNELIFKVKLDNTSKNHILSRCEFLIRVMTILIHKQKYATDGFLQLISKIDDIEKNHGLLFPKYELIQLYFKIKPHDRRCRQIIQHDAEISERSGDDYSVISDLTFSQFANEYYNKALELYRVIKLQDSVYRLTKKLRDINHAITSSKDITKVDVISPKVYTKAMQRDLQSFSKMPFLNQLKIITDKTVIINETLLHDYMILPEIKLISAFKHTSINSKGDVFASSDDPKAVIDMILADCIRKIYNRSLGNYYNVLFYKKQLFDFKKLFLSNSILKNSANGFSTSMSLFFNDHDYDNSSVLLSSNLEYLFREIAGVSCTVKHKNDNSVVYRSLSNTFKSEKLQDYLGDYAWIFEELLLKEPMNIRNKAAHGIKDVDLAVMSYLMSCVLKLMFDKNIISVSE